MFTCTVDMLKENTETLQWQWLLLCWMKYIKDGYEWMKFHLASRRPRYQLILMDQLCATRMPPRAITPPPTKTYTYFITTHDESTASFNCVLITVILWTGNYLLWPEPPDICHLLKANFSHQQTLWWDVWSGRAIGRRTADYKRYDSLTELIGYSLDNWIIV